MSNNIFKWVLCHIKSLIQPRSGGTKLLILVDSVWKQIENIKVIGVNLKAAASARPQKRVYLNPNPTANLVGEKREECLFG